MRAFKYDIKTLISGVRQHSCLWDKSLESYKDRTERKEAWEKIFQSLDESYHEMSDEEKRLTGELIVNKWTNIRDTFIKSLKTKMGRPKKKYLFHDQLKFLIPQSQGEDYYTGSDFVSTHVKLELNNDEEHEHRKTRRSRKREHSEEPITKESDKTDLSFMELDEYNDPRVMNEDEAFFASLLPSIVKYSQDERLEFRMEVLAVMKRIRDKSIARSGDVPF